jgi:hypothetical protein
LTQKQFNAARLRLGQPSKRPKLLVATIKKAISYDATECARGYFLGCEWTPADNFQAEDRLHRIGQSRAVEIAYLVNRGTYEEHVLDVVAAKKRWSELTFDPRTLLFPDG